jgi:carbon storage regulator
MLALTRKLGESIKIGQDITVTVTSIDRNRVRLGITAPRDVLILRTEVQERINGLDERGIPAE